MRGLDPDCAACDETGPAGAGGGVLARLFDTSDFPPRWQCGEWDAFTGWLHITADLTTWFAYVCIPVLLATMFVRRRQDIPMPGLFLLFAAFILACGTVHLMEAAMFYWPAYRLQGVIKLCTALVSIATVVALAWVLPRALELRGPKQLEKEVEQRTAELRESEALCAQAQVQAERADAAKSRFLASMSHELRTPVAAILGMVDLLTEEDPEGEERRESIEAIRRNASHQLELINDVLELSRIEAESIELSPSPVNARELAKESLELMGTKARDKGLEVVLDHEGQEYELAADPLRVRQVLVNLLSNAVKFTESGTIRVVVRADEEGGEVRVTYEVHDTGIGLNPDQVERIFDPYAQAEATTVARFGGTGLGLSISRQLARLMGGGLVATSTPGAGSCFTFTLRGPAMRVPEQARTTTKQPPVDLSGIRVLLAEDQPDIALVVTRQLERVGCEVVHAADGTRTVAAFEEGGFDLVLLDLQLPDMSGFDVARSLRESGWTGPLVALTANALTQDRDRCLASGFDDFATKPLEARDLRRLVEFHAGRRDAA